MLASYIIFHPSYRCHENASGYWGPWTRAETTFSNEYFNALLNETWTPKKTHNGLCVLCFIFLIVEQYVPFRERVLLSCMYLLLKCGI